MKRRLRILGSTLGLFCTVAEFHASDARAEDASAAETAAARSLAVDGLKLAQANNCAEAVPKLERAEKLYHSAVVASRLGECYVSVGRLVEGTEVLRKVLREPQPADATPALTKALDRAQRVLDAAKPKIAGLTVKVTTVPDMRVKIDGNVVPNALVDTEVPTDPGEHTIEVTAPGFLKTTSRIGMGEGDKKSVTMNLARDPNAVVPAAPVEAAAASGSAPPPNNASEPAPETATTHHAEPLGPPNRTAAYVSLGIGAAAVATGGVLGVLTMKRYKSIHSHCPNDVCAADQQSDLDSAKRLGTFSTIGFGVGAAGLVLGTVLIFTAGPSNVDHAAKAHKPQFAGLSSPRVAIGPTQIELGADF
jgi:hypothetical protein